VKIAVVTEADGRISRHFGRAPHYQVFTLADGQITATELRAKPGHDQFIHEVHEHEHHHEPGQQHGTGPQAANKHDRMIAPVRDCEAVIVGGMGQGGYQALQQAGIRPFITDLDDPAAAVRAYADGTLVDHTELLH
jgi:predicted Fe-Mo cluster-binding NifX family protein